MLDPAELLAVARLLSAEGASASPSEARLRRAISTAYYALFHSVLRRAADRFLGADRRDKPAYAVLYRAFTHSRMKSICKEIDKPLLKDQYKAKLRRDFVSQELRDFASIFAGLQELREIADYDPQAIVFQSDAIGACGSAEFGIQAFQNSDPDEVTDVLALMLAGVRD